MVCENCQKLTLIGSNNNKANNNKANNNKANNNKANNNKANNNIHTPASLLEVEEGEQDEPDKVGDIAGRVVALTFVVAVAML